MYKRLLEFFFLLKMILEPKCKYDISIYAKRVHAYKFVSFIWITNVNCENVQGIDSIELNLRMSLKYNLLSYMVFCLLFLLFFIK